jgi:hypothetical protein
MASIVRDSLFGGDLGRGIDGLSGGIRGQAVDFSPPRQSTGGQSSTFFMKQIETTEDIASELQVSVDAEAQFSMFGGSDKFRFTNSKSVHNYHLYLLIHVVVTNPDTVLNDVRLKSNAADVAVDPARFHEEFGDFFVLGERKGGEYAALLDIHTSDSTEHEAMSNELKAAGFGGGFAFAAEAKVSITNCHHLSTATVDISEMQLGGQADPTPVGAKEIIEKAENFRKTALDNGVTLKLLLQDYKALDLPKNANPVDLQVQKDVLNDCFIQKMRLSQALNSVEFILSNATQFEPPEPGVDLNAFRDMLAKAVNAYNHQASACLNDFRQCTLVSPSPADT